MPVQPFADVGDPLVHDPLVNHEGIQCFDIVLDLYDGGRLLLGNLLEFGGGAPEPEHDKKASTAKGGDLEDLEDRVDDLIRLDKNAHFMT